MKNIWKFPIAVTDETATLMPAGAHVLTAQLQAGSLCLWAIVDADAPPEKRIFRVIGTGHPIPDDDRLRYIDTVLMPNLGLVFHVFEKSPAPAARESAE